MFKYQSPSAPSVSAGEVSPLVKGEPSASVGFYGGEAVSQVLEFSGESASIGRES